MHLSISPGPLILSAIYPPVGIPAEMSDSFDVPGFHLHSNERQQIAMYIDP